MHITRPLAHLLAVAGLAVAVPALAHPHLVTTDPAQGATVAKVSRVTLNFSEPLIAGLSGIEVVMTAMPGMEHHAAMKMTGVRVSVGPDGTSLVASLPRPLSTGSYEADWHAVSTDTHRVTGKLTFTVE
jgi:methionine-rich copper-binding protein CopC